MTTQDIELSVVILCYRSGNRIRYFTDKVINILEKNVPSWEMVLVGNYVENTDDNTPSAVKDIASKHKNIQAVTLPKKGMMGWDARSGLDKATGRYLCLIDGDEQMPPEDIIRVYKKITDEGLDIVTTHRMRRYDGMIRSLNSFLYNLITKILFPGIKVKDINSKPKVLTKNAYDKMSLKSDDWFLDAEMIIKASRLKIKTGEVPTEFHKCSYRKSFVRPGTVFEFVKNLLKARINGGF